MSQIPRNAFLDGDEPSELEPAGPDWDPGAPEFQTIRAHVPKRFLATTALVVVFFTGAAFVASAGDQAAKLIQNEDSSQAASGGAAADSSAADPAPADAAPADPAAAPAAADPAVTPESAPGSDDVPPRATAAAPAPADSAAPAGAAAPADPAAPPDASSASDAAPSAPGADDVPPRSAAAAAPAPAPAPVEAARRVHKQLTVRKPAPDPEVRQPGVSATIWLNRALPDPTPPAKRLTAPFAAQLAATGRHYGADWALVLGVLRAEGATGSAPATRATLVRLSRRLVALEADGRDKWEATAAFGGDTATADRAVALGHYYRAVGLWALVHGLQAAKPALVDKVLADPRVSIYAGGRDDLMKGRVNVRVVAVMAYLAEEFGQVTVSCLISGHRLYARPGVVSAHVYGDAVDIAALGGQSILGHQEPGSVTEHAVRDLLLLPSELMPKQVISLLGLGGPSFPEADHYNHIHVGF